ncbi:hypothetical protein K402DRAFT_395144 [Aulographum hederae CBS 113979]|uniref:Uncharacterized protein n=1 Tax=Aulographum hederae CBS 113979 TaxID=1176131 RepID=A0A6G1GVV6_9PEZI|nr:hypothetical protein K402DRAFT_395144 [Aulographum hederae CBS 113979]
MNSGRRSEPIEPNEPYEPNRHHPSALCFSLQHPIDRQTADLATTSRELDHEIRDTRGTHSLLSECTDTWQRRARKGGPRKNSERPCRQSTLSTPHLLLLSQAPTSGVTNTDPCEKEKDLLGGARRKIRRGIGRREGGRRGQLAIMRYCDRENRLLELLRVGGQVLSRKILGREDVTGCASNLTLMVQEVRIS